jgi:thioredoxin 1
MKKFILILFAAVFISSCGKEEVEIPFSKSELVDITSLNQYDNIIKTGVSLMFFHATWCTICKAQRPNVLGLLEDAALKNVNFGEIDKDKNKPISDNYQVIGQPVIVIYKDNEEKHRLSGSGHSASVLANLLKELNP